MNLSSLLKQIPEHLREPLLQSYRSVAINFIERRWEPSELNGAKFCEVVYCILVGAISGTYPVAVEKPRDMPTACRKLESEPPSSGRKGDQSLRVLIPKMLLPLYEVRNKRNVGHLGGDVDPNFMDASAVYSIASWILAELIRIFHDVSTKEAQEAVNVLVERRHPLVWEVNGVRRVLDPSMQARDQVLVLLYGRASSTSMDNLFSWIEHSNKTVFRNKVLAPLHDARLIEVDKNSDMVTISPLGIEAVEANILKTRI